MSKNELSRQFAIKALQENPMVFSFEEHLTGLNDSLFEVTFEELGMDSLARMELSIWLEIECGIEVTEAKIMKMKSLAGLARFIEANLKREK